VKQFQEVSNTSNVAVAAGNGQLSLVYDVWVLVRVHSSSCGQSSIDNYFCTSFTSTFRLTFLEDKINKKYFLRFVRPSRGSRECTGALAWNEII
jgi:hypothetical protein